MFAKPDNNRSFLFISRLNLANFLVLQLVWYKFITLQKSIHCVEISDLKLNQGFHWQGLESQDSRESIGHIDIDFLKIFFAQNVDVWYMNVTVLVCPAGGATVEVSCIAVVCFCTCSATCRL